MVIDSWNKLPDCQKIGENYNPLVLRFYLVLNLAKQIRNSRRRKVAALQGGFLRSMTYITELSRLTRRFPGLCQRRRWADPLFETRRSHNGWTCSVRVNNREFKCDQICLSEQMAQEKAAEVAYNICRNFSLSESIYQTRVNWLPVAIGSGRLTGRSYASCTRDYDNDQFGRITGYSPCSSISPESEGSIISDYSRTSSDSGYYSIGGPAYATLRDIALRPVWADNTAQKAQSRPSSSCNRIIGKEAIPDDDVQNIPADDKTGSPSYNAVHGKKDQRLRDEYGDRQALETSRTTIELEVRDAITGSSPIGESTTLCQVVQADSESQITAHQATVKTSSRFKAEEEYSNEIDEGKTAKAPENTPNVGEVESAEPVEHPKRNGEHAVKDWLNQTLEDTFGPASTKLTSIKISASTNSSQSKGESPTRPPAGNEDVGVSAEMEINSSDDYSDAGSSISDTESCDLSADSDSSRGRASSASPILLDLKQDLIKRVMADFLSMIGCAGGHASEGPASSSFPCRGQSSGSSNQNCSGGGGRNLKRVAESEGHADDEENEDGSNESKRLRRFDQRQSNERKFACPYFKRNPAKDHEWRSCYGPGYKSVHRVKYNNLEDKKWILEPLT